jgi:hypothetical protein
MAVAPIGPPHIVMAPQLSEGDPDDDEIGDPMTKCGRCRISFVRHPSISPDDSPRWWLCPPCRTRLLGDEKRTSARWSS